MDALALILVQLDVTPAQLAEISRASFVKAGAAIARKKHSPRPHIARIASLTGIPRSEVRKIIAANYIHNSGRLDQLPRALRVVAAWKTAPKYTRNGKPLTLKVIGRAPSFQALCREFSGDIPHKAIATELLARKLIRFKKNGAANCVHLNRSPVSKDSQMQSTLTYIANFMDSVSSQDRILVRRKQTIVSPKNLSVAYFQNSIASRVASFVDELPIDPKHRVRTKKNDEILDVFALVSRKLRKP